MYRSNETKPENYIFPILNDKRVYDTEYDILKEISRKNALINKYLKQICLKATVPKGVSFHSARHTFKKLLELKQAVEAALEQTDKDIVLYSPQLRRTVFIFAQKSYFLP